jgi:DNA (cytosine-5)-methyltransferase 1
MNVLSLFTGAGGLDLGLEAAGFHIAGCVERDPDCRRTLKRNTRWTLAMEGEISAIEPAALLAELGLKHGEVTLLAGGPPCQPFSKAGQWRHGTLARMADPRSETLRKYFDVLEAARPEVMLLENVKGFVAASTSNSAEQHALNFLSESLASVNRRYGTSYEPSVIHVQAADFGVPQRRERVFIVAHRGGRRVADPRPTHSDCSGASADRVSQPWHATAWDAIGDLDVEEWDPALAPSGRWAALLPSIPEGRNYLWHTDHQDGEPLFGWRRKYWSFLLKLAKDRPSWTIQASPGPATGPFHWRSRKLSVREMARLQTFPDSHIFEGHYQSARKQIGNAVPVALGELLGLEIRRQLLGHKDLGNHLTSIPDRRDDCPPAEPVADVPDEYLQLRGEHSSHPGHGMGPGALTRNIATNT